MYCQHCGKDAGENTICPECGKPIVVQSGNAEVVQQKSKKGKRITIIIISAVAATILCILIVGFGLFWGLSKVKTDTASEQIAATDVESAKNADPKDTEQTISEAKSLAEDGQYADAIKLLQTVPQTDDISSLIMEYAEVYLKAADYGCYWEEDEMSDYHWAYANGQNNDVRNFSLCVYIHQNKSDKSDYGFHLYASFIGYSGKNEWILPNTMRIKGDKNEAIDLYCGLDNDSDRKGGSMCEWVNFNISQEKMDAICKTAEESSTITVRFSGSTYHRDFTLTAQQITALKVIGAYGAAFAEVYGASA